MSTKRTWVVRSGADLGRAIADARNLARITQADLGAAADLARSYVAQIESGRTSSLIEHQLRLLRRLGAEVTVTVELPGPSDAET